MSSDPLSAFFVHVWRGLKFTSCRVNPSWPSALDAQVKDVIYEMVTETFCRKGCSGPSATLDEPEFIQIHRQGKYLEHGVKAVSTHS